MSAERYRQPETRLGEERADKWPRRSFQTHSGEGERSRTVKHVLPEGRGLLWPGLVGDDVRVFLALEEVAGFFMFCQSPWEMGTGGSSIGGHVTSLLQSRNLFI